MNKDPAKGKWKHLRGTAEKAEGSRDAPIGVIQEQIGDAEEEIREKRD
jgi:uncharacterized protein YjbJ (UPF0337 family)